MDLFLTLLSGVCWSVVHIELIRKGFKDKTYGMPLFALCLNLAWELIYSVDQHVLGTASVQGWVNLVWAVLDAIIVYTYFKYGRKYFPEKGKKYFVPFSVLAFASCFVMQFAFYFHFESSVTAAEYSAFAQNAYVYLVPYYAFESREYAGTDSAHGCRKMDWNTGPGHPDGHSPKIQHLYYSDGRSVQCV